MHLIKQQSSIIKVRAVKTGRIHKFTYDCYRQLFCSSIGSGKRGSYLNLYFDRVHESKIGNKSFDNTCPFIRGLTNSDSRTDYETLPFLKM